MKLKKVIINKWRSLTRFSKATKEKTLVACSGGADSLALLLALSKYRDFIIVGHVIHDIRPEFETQVDRDTAKNLADRLGIKYDERKVKVSRKGNLESNARDVRYKALVEMAKLHNCKYIAIAHHGDDLIETFLMRMIRGSGPTGLSGLSEIRILDKSSGITLIRPMLSLTRKDTENICTLDGIKWATDSTNADTTYLRSYIRYNVSPLLKKVSNNLHEKIYTTTGLLRESSNLVNSRCKKLQKLYKNDILDRIKIKKESDIVLGQLLKSIIQKTTNADKVTNKHIKPIIKCIKSNNTNPKMFILSGTTVKVTAYEVIIKLK